MLAYPRLIECASEELKADKDVALAAIQLSHYNAKAASKTLWTDTDILLAIVSQGSDPLVTFFDYWGSGDDAADDAAADPVLADVKALVNSADFRLAAALTGALSYATDEQKADKSFVLAAVQKQGLAIAYTTEELKADREVALAAVQQHGDAIEQVDESLWSDAEVVLTALQCKNPDSHCCWYGRVAFASPNNKELLSNREIVKAAVAGRAENLPWSSNELRSDKEIVLTALSGNGADVAGCAWTSISPTLKMDPDVRAAARVACVPEHWM